MSGHDVSFSETGAAPAQFTEQQSVDKQAAEPLGVVLVELWSMAADLWLLDLSDIFNFLL